MILLLILILLLICDDEDEEDNEEREVGLGVRGPTRLLTGGLRIGDVVIPLFGVGVTFLNIVLVGPLDADEEDEEEERGAGLVVTDGPT